MTQYCWYKINVNWWRAGGKQWWGGREWESGGFCNDWRWGGHRRHDTCWDVSSLVLLKNQNWCGPLHFSSTLPTHPHYIQWTPYYQKILINFEKFDNSNCKIHAFEVYYRYFCSLRGHAQSILTQDNDIYFSLSIAQNIMIYVLPFINSLHTNNRVV